MAKSAANLAGHGARVQPLELVPGAQICARAPTKGYLRLVPMPGYHTGISQDYNIDWSVYVP